MRERVLLGLSDWLVAASPAATILAKATALLALAWVVHASLWRGNPRWRLALWRSVLCGLAALPLFAIMPPIVTWRLAVVGTGAVAAADEGDEAAPPVIATAPAPAALAASPVVVASHPDPTPERVADRPRAQAPPSFDPIPASSPGLWVPDPGTCFFALWLCGATVFAIRFSVGSWRLRRVIARAADAPAPIVDEARRIGERLGVGPLRIAEVDAVPSPCLVGLRRPVLLLGGVGLDDPADLRAVLAHELAHVRGRDLAWNAAANLAGIVLWFQPLTWRVREAHASACDAVADAVAADLLGDVAGYGRTLARMAIRVVGPLSTQGLAMARPSRVRRRIESLRRKLHRSPLPRAVALPALAISALIVAIVGGFAVAMAEAPQAPAERSRRLPAPASIGAIEAVAVLADGKPAAGAQVAIVKRGAFPYLATLRFRPAENLIVLTADDRGRFTIPSQNDTYVIMSSHDGGFVVAHRDELSATGKLVLRPWGRIEGRLRIGDAPAKGIGVTYTPHLPNRNGESYQVDLDDRVQSDAEGRFVFQRAIPGPATVARCLPLNAAGTRMAWGWQESVEIPPGGVVNVDVGGRGRSVVGRTMLGGSPARPVNWPQTWPVELVTKTSRWGAGGRGRFTYPALMDQQGRFHIEDVPPGEYDLQLMLSGRSLENPASPPLISVTTLNVVVPEGPRKASVDLGDVVAAPRPSLAVGDVAPGFTVPRLGGGRIKLADCAGRLVLLHFWSTPDFTLPDLSVLVDLHKTLAGNPRFALIGLSCGEEIGEAASITRKWDLDWPQGHAGTLQGGAGRDYLLHQVPANFLIGPDGRILARDVHGQQMKDLVIRSLGDESLFDPARIASRPPRFPITSFPTPVAGTGAIDLPAAVVLDDCDPDYEKGRPHHDALRFLDGAGRELRVSKDLDVCMSSCGAHRVAIDAVRGRVYVCENVADRLTALDLQGRPLWRVDKIQADCIALDPATGNIWCSGANSIQSGETVIVDPSGKEVDTLPFGAMDIAYDPKTDAFWLVNTWIRKLSRKGDVLVAQPCEGWMFSSVAVNPVDGSVWIGERSHPQMAGSASRLWHLDAQGKLIRARRIDGKDFYAVSCDQQTGIVATVGLGSEVLRFAADGRSLPAFAVPPRATAIAAGNDGDVWVATKSEILRIDRDGKVLARTAREPGSDVAWMAIFPRR